MLRKLRGNDRIEVRSQKTKLQAYYTKPKKRFLKSLHQPKKQCHLQLLRHGIKPRMLLSKPTTMLPRERQTLGRKLQSTLMYQPLRKIMDVWDK